METLTQSELKLIHPFVKEWLGQYDIMLRSPSIPNKARLRNKFQTPLLDGMIRAQANLSLTKWQKTLLLGCVKENEGKIPDEQIATFESVLKKLHVSFS